MPSKDVAVERRRRNRLRLRLPVRVRGRDESGSTWEELTSCIDASVQGVGLLVNHPVNAGQVLHLALPLPITLRQYDFAESSYRTYALVRNRSRAEDRARVGVRFIGPSLPQGHDALPSGRFALDGDQVSADVPPAVHMRLTLPAEEAPGGLAQDEHVAVERLTPRTAVVRVRHLPVSRGMILTVELAGEEYRSRAAVSAIAIDAEGHARLTLEVLDAPLPPHLATADPTTDH